MWLWWTLGSVIVLILVIVGIFVFIKASKLELNLKNTHVQSGVEPFAKFDGISDFSDVASNTVNTLAAVLRNRVNSFINGGD